MMNFYKSVIEHRGKLLVRGIHEGQDYKEKIDFGPTLYSLTQKESKFKTLDNRNLNPIKFKDISAARQFRRCNSKLSCLWSRTLSLSVHQRTISTKHQVG
jgi:hypothetical protein